MEGPKYCKPLYHRKMPILIYGGNNVRKKHEKIGKSMKKHFRKSEIFLLLFIILCILLIVVTAQYHSQVNFFRDLGFEDIAQIQIYSTWFEDGVQSVTTLSEADALRVYEKLIAVRLYGLASKEFKGYIPITTKMYIIKLCDNTVLEFSASSPFYIIDQEKGFRGDRLLCHQLADLYSQLDACYFPRAVQ